MSGTPKYKVYRENKYIGCVKFLEDAAALVSLSGEGEVRFSHAKSSTIWREGEEEFSAGESYDQAADVMSEREFQIQSERFKKKHGHYPDE